MTRGDDEPIAPSGAAPTARGERRHRQLRAILAADITGFSGQLSINETATVQRLGVVRRLALAELKTHHGWLFGMPGDGLFALFHSAIDAVTCALAIQDKAGQETSLGGMKLRIGIHLGEVLFDDGLPYGEALAIAARLEGLADPGRILVSSNVYEAAAPRVIATFEERGRAQLKNIPRRIETFVVDALKDAPAGSAAKREQNPTLDQTMLLDRSILKNVRDGTYDPDYRPPASNEANELQTLQNDRNTPQQEPQMVSRSTTADCEPVHVRGDDALPDALISALTEALIHHLGPIAPVLIEQASQAAVSTDDLVARLEEEIPSGDERLAFRLAATRICLDAKS